MQQAVSHFANLTLEQWFMQATADGFYCKTPEIIRGHQFAFL